MIKKILLILSALLVIGVILVFTIFYRSDLSKEDLAKTYMNAESKFIELPSDANMHYRDEGNPNGPVLVMIHGGFGSLHNWEGWVPYLKNDFRLISMDLLGHGLTGKYPENVYDRHTERDAVHQLLQKLGVSKKYTLAGNSFGGGIALEIALEFPDEVAGLILVDSEGIPNGEDGYDASLFNDDAVSPEQAEFKQPSLLERIGSKFIGPAVIKSTLGSMTYNKALLTDEYVDYFARILRYKGNREAQLLMFRQGLYLISKNDKMDLLPRLKEIKVPTLVMHGKQDTLLPLRVSERFAKEIAISDLAVIDEAGHMPMIEKPKETAEDVVSFIKKYNIK